MPKFLRNILTIAVFALITAMFVLLAYILHNQINSTKKITREISCKDGIAHAYFSPKDDIKDKLTTLIEKEKEAIYVAIYTITDRNIAQSLIEAQDRGVVVQVVVDKSYGSGTYSKVPMLCNNRVPVWVYQTPEALMGNNNNKQWSLMHNKFVVFCKNLNDKPLVWTGSFNFTRSANNFNRENVIIVDNSKIVCQFQNQFQELKLNSLLISGNPKEVKFNFVPLQSSWFNWTDWILSGEWLNSII